MNLLGVRRISSHAHKIVSYLLGLPFKISDGHPSAFYIEIPPVAISFTEEYLFIKASYQQ